MAQKEAALLEVIRKSEGTVITYCATRKTAEAVTGMLQASRVEAACYHGGLSDDERHRVQEAFVSGEATALVATNAFGMGIDKADVRAVVHYDLPGSVEAYYQEVGRAGRDGAPALGLLLFTYADTRIHEFFISRGGEELPPDLRASLAERERDKLRAMVRYAYDEGCRHGAILNHFGEPFIVGPEGCGSCDGCTGQAGLGDMALVKALGSGGGSHGRSRGRRSTPNQGPLRSLSGEEAVVVQKALSGVARSEGRLTGGDLVRVLRGSTRPETLADPLAETPSSHSRTPRR